MENPPAPRTARAVAAVTVGLGVLLTSGCDMVSPSPARSSSAAVAPTHVATTVSERIAQSHLEAKLGPNPAERVSGGAMVVAPAGTATPDGLVDASREAVQDVRHLDPKASSNPLLVVGADSDAEFKRLVGRPPGDDELATTKTNGATVLPFVVLAPRTKKKPDAPLTRETVVHEAFHALTLEHLAVKRERWLIEGWAEYIGQQAIPVAERKRDDVRAHLPSDGELLGENGQDADAAYYAAWSFARYLRGTYGNDAVMSFYDDAVTSLISLDALAQTHFHHTIAQLEAGYQAWYPTYH